MFAPHAATSCNNCRSLRPGVAAQQCWPCSSSDERQALRSALRLGAAHFRMATAPQGWLFNICDDPQRCVSDPTLGLSVWFRQLWRVSVCQTF